MRQADTPFRMRLMAGGILCLAVAAGVADRCGLLATWRPVLHDALSPGRLTLLSMREWTTPAATNSEAESPANIVSVDRAELQRSQQLLRQLMIDNARLRRDLRREQTESAIAERIEPAGTLARFDAISAQVLSTSGMPSDVRELLIDAGRATGARRSELVVDGTGLFISAGRDRGIEPGDRVLTGAVVVGRIEKTARWVSLVQPLTAVGFKARVSLLRTTNEGPHFGATGMLEGTGESNCRLTGIAQTEAVAVGDEVVSADVNNLHGPRLYFGKVVRADFLAGGEWDVRVEPEAKLDELESVGILRLSVSPLKP